MIGDRTTGSPTEIADGGDGMLIGVGLVRCSGGTWISLDFEVSLDFDIDGDTCGGKGVIAIKTSDRNGEVVSALQVTVPTLSPYTP